MTRRDQIISEQHLYLSYLPHVRAQFGGLPGIQMIGLGAKEQGGQLTEEWAFRFYVSEKKQKENIPAGEYIPERILGVKTDVISHFEKESLVCEADVLSIDSNSYRDQGIRGGIPIRNEYFDNDQPSGYGTLGVLARRKADNGLVGLTCAHVVNAASQDLTAVNVKIGQPKYWITCCCCPHGYIGDVAKSTFNADLDCAIIAIHDDIEEKITANNTERKIEGISADITGAAAMVCFDTVTKRGRSTGTTTGKVSDIAYGTNQMLIERTGNGADGPFACHGDSGAVVVNSSNQVVGLVVAAARGNMKRTIVTHIKPVMQELDITIAGTDAAAIGEPLGGGPSGCELFIWPGGQTDTALNPAETFASSDFGFTGAVNWDVSKGAGGAVIVETGAQTANGLASISVRYDIASHTKNPTDTVQVQAISGGETHTKFRTIFAFTPKPVNTSSPLDADNTKSFDIKGGTTNLAGVHTPVDAGDWFMAKAEIIFDITPHDIGWSGGGAISFVTGNPPGNEGNIIARRETKFTKGEQANGAANRTHTDQVDFISAGDSTADDMQAPTNAKPNALYRLAGEGFDPSGLLQGYVRADYRDYIEFHTGTQWVRISPYAEWFANLTGTLNTAPPPGTADPNNMGAGASAEKVPNQKPVITPVEAFREIKPTENLTLSVSITDSDNDLVTVGWTQTAGPTAALSTFIGTSTVFTAPAGDFQFKFSAVGNDDTELLSRNAGNFKSDPVEIVVNVVEWKNTGGGDPIPGRNITEVFNAANFGIGAGGLNWDVTTGGIAAVIIEADGAVMAPAGTVNGATTIKVRYDNASGDLTRAQTVKIQATHPVSGKSWFKRRTVFRVTMAVHASDKHTFLIPSLAGVSGQDHFCTAQGQGDTLLQAVIVPAPAPADITWQGTGAFAFTVPGTGADRLTAKISSNTGTGQDIPFTISIAGDICYNGRYWTIWSTGATTVRPFASARNAGGISTAGGYNFTFTIQPAAIIPPAGTTPDLPDLIGANATPPPDVSAGDVSVYQKGVALGGGAVAKWDVTRRARQHVFNPDGVVWDPGTRVDFRTTFLNYPSNVIVGNDDTHTGDPEDNDPYTAPGVGIITGTDFPTDGMLDTEGDDDNSVEIRFHCQEFLRIELNRNWFLASPNINWKIHFLWHKPGGHWEDNGSFIALDNNGF